MVVPVFERRAPGVYHNTAVVLEKDGAIVFKKTFSITNNTPAVQFAVKPEYAPNVYARSSVSDRFEIERTDEPVTMLKVARNLFLALGNRFSFSTTPGGNRIGDFEASWQNRTAVDGSRVHVAGEGARLHALVRRASQDRNHEK